MSFRHRVDIFLRKFEKNFATHNQIEVSRSALLYNLNLFKNLTNQSIIPVLKGNAYGHGLSLVAEALVAQNIPYIAVDGYFEALRIRAVSRQSVLIMGAILPQNFQHLKYDRFAFVVQDETSIRELGKVKKNIKVHLEINIGMNRYGVKPEEVEKLSKLINHYKNLKLEGVMGHLADSDGKDPTTVEVAVKQFDKAVESVLATGANPTMFHVAQSAGSLKAKSMYANVIRLGIGLYGINPFPRTHKMHNELRDLKPALRLTSTITKIIELKKGDQVSYNYTYTASRNLRIGILPIGYYEGVNRALSNAGIVKIGKRFSPIVGRVCMNHTMINLEDSAAKVGDRAVIYSSNTTDHNSVDNIAFEHRLFNYNMLTNLSHDVRRILVK